VWISGILPSTGNAMAAAAVKKIHTIRVEDFGYVLPFYEMGCLKLAG
jgi:hypothetical protein